MVQANFILVLDDIIDERWAAGWWSALAKAECVEFEPIAGDLESRLSVLRTVVQQADDRT